MGRLYVVVVVRRGDRFFPGTLFQDRHRRPNGRRAGKKLFLGRVELWKGGKVSEQPQ